MPPATVGPVVVPHGGNGGGPTTRKGGHGGPATTTKASASTAHKWTTWWSYNAEWILARHMRGKPVTGLTVPGDTSDVRRALREQRLFELMVRAFNDKRAQPRETAAVALGKFGMARADRYLWKRTKFPQGEGWYTVREASLYAIGVLGLPENRSRMLAVARDKERALRERSITLVQLLADGTQKSADQLWALLKAKRVGSLTRSGAVPHRIAQEHRRFAAHLLGFVRHQGYESALRAAAQGSRRYGAGEQGLAITALARRGSYDDLPMIRRKLNDRDSEPDVVRSCAIALGLLGRATRERPADDDTIAVLRRFVRDRNNEIVARHFAVMALARIGGEKAVDALLGFLRKKSFVSSNDRAFVYIALGLCARGHAGARDTLLALFDRRSTGTERGALAVALGLIHHPSASKSVIKAVNGTSDRDLLAWGSLGLGLLGGRGASDAIDRVFTTYAIPKVRRQAAIGMVLLKRGAAAKRLIRELKESGNAHEKAAIADALRLLRNPKTEIVDALIEAYERDSNSNHVRSYAIAALGALADPRDIPYSAELVRDYNYFIKCWALDLIASLL